MDFDQVSPKSMEFLYKVSEQPNDFNKLATALILEMETKNLIAPDFSDSFEWLNTSDKLSFQGNLKHKIVVLDFFTYCCINCMHVLPDLHALEKKFSIEDGVAVVGVHSAKFQNEKVLTNILSAVMRYDICHPVVNDSAAVMWNAMSIQCWPTFVVVSPEGKVLLYLVGEGHRKTLLQFVDVALHYYKEKGLIKCHTLPIKLAKDSTEKTQLKFPGKIAVSNDNGQIAVADTGNHQIVVLDSDGVIFQRIGSGSHGFQDGSFNEARFFAPQGLAWFGNELFIADTENHAIRKINFDTSEVSTVTGTGTQGNDKEGGSKGIEQEISSPWDVVIGPSPGSDIAQTESSCLYIAMAGTHQIWCYFLQNGGWLKKGSKDKDTCCRFAGSGSEENRNNSYPHKAAFAQPSGLTLGVTKDSYFLYEADSESSSVRSIQLLNGAVKACVGAERDPMNLFAYGDTDGKGFDAKLQHPLAVEYRSLDEFVYVADSYNHKIKVIDPVTLICTTLAGTGESGHKNGSFKEASFNEPGDLKFSVDMKLLYVADTNNHVIRVLDMEKETVSDLPTLNVTCMSNFKLTTSQPENKGGLLFIVSNKAHKSTLETIERNLDSPCRLILNLELSDGLQFTEGAEGQYHFVFRTADKGDVISYTKGVFNEDCCQTEFHIPESASDLDMDMELLLFVCTSDHACLMKEYHVRQRIQRSKDGGNETVILTHIVKL